MLGFKDRKALTEELKAAKETIRSLEEALSSEREKNTKVSALSGEAEAHAKDLDTGLTRVVNLAKEIGEMGDAHTAHLRDVEEALKKTEKDMQVLYDGYSRLAGTYDVQKKQVDKLREDSKSYTGIAKTLQSAVESYKKNATVVLEETTKMEEFAGNIGTLSLNAAIEAGRLGESAMKFVKAADDVRGFAEEYETSAGTAKAAAEEMEKSFASSAEDIKTLIALLRDNTVLLKKISDAAEKEYKFVKENPQVNPTEVFSDLSHKAGTLFTDTDETLEKKQAILDEMEHIGEAYMAEGENLKGIQTTVNEVTPEEPETKEEEQTQGE